MKPQFPFKDKYQITQGFLDNANNYPGGHHGALDIVPLDASGKPFPANIYPVFDGSEVSIMNTSPVHGKGARESLQLDAPFIAYLKSKGVAPQNFAGRIDLELLYWHCLKVLDLDGILTQDTPVAQAGNTGDVYHNGVKVPDNQKGVPPYLGLHLHLETLLRGDGKLLNLDKDYEGRIDPMIILSYQGQDMNTYVKTLNLDGEVGYFVPLNDENPGEIELLGSIFNKQLVVNPDGTIPTEIKAKKI